MADFAQDTRGFAFLRCLSIDVFRVLTTRTISTPAFDAVRNITMTYMHLKLEEQAWLAS